MIVQGEPRPQPAPRADHAWLAHARSAVVRSHERNHVVRAVLEILIVVTEARTAHVRPDRRVYELLATAETMGRGPDDDGWARQLRWAAAEARSVMVRSGGETPPR